MNNRNTITIVAIIVMVSLVLLNEMLSTKASIDSFYSSYLQTVMNQTVNNPELFISVTVKYDKDSHTGRLVKVGGDYICISSGYEWGEYCIPFTEIAMIQHNKPFINR